VGADGGKKAGAKVSRNRASTIWMGERGRENKKSKKKTVEQRITQKKKRSEKIYKGLHSSLEREMENTQPRGDQ